MERKRERGLFTGYFIFLARIRRARLRNKGSSSIVYYYYYYRAVYFLSLLPSQLDDVVLHST